jgi:hypothetical protein
MGPRRDDVNDIAVSQIQPSDLNPEIGMGPDLEAQIVDIPLDGRFIILGDNQKMFEVGNSHG